MASSPPSTSKRPEALAGEDRTVLDGQSEDYFRMGVCSPVRTMANASASTAERAGKTMRHRHAQSRHARSLIGDRVRAAQAPASPDPASTGHSSASACPMTGRHQVAASDTREFSTQNDAPDQGRQGYHASQFNRFSNIVLSQDLRSQSRSIQAIPAPTTGSTEHDAVHA